MGKAIKSDIQRNHEELLKSKGIKPQEYRDQMKQELGRLLISGATADLDPFIDIFREKELEEAFQQYLTDMNRKKEDTKNNNQEQYKVANN